MRGPTPTRRYALWALVALFLWCSQTAAGEHSGHIKQCKSDHGMMTQRLGQQVSAGAAHLPGQGPSGASSQPFCPVSWHDLGTCAVFKWHGGAKQFALGSKHSPSEQQSHPQQLAHQLLSAHMHDPNLSELLSMFPAGQGIPAKAPNQLRGVGIQAYSTVLRDTKTGASFRAKYAASPQTTCTRTTSSWCGAAPGSDKYQALLVATSPAVYDARTDAGDEFNPIGPVLDQRPCETSVAFAVTAAAQAAAASALQLNGSDISLSQQDLQFCPGLVRGCYDSWDIKSGLDRLVNGTVVDSDCLPYTAPQSDDPARLCNYRCRDPPKAILRGSFGYRQLRTVVDAQKQLRRYGSFITRFNLYPDFFQWVEKTPGSSRDAVYTCPSTLTPPADSTAVTVVGYDNIKQAWLVKNRYAKWLRDKDTCVTQ